jgi:hypothetical protein
LQRQGRTIGAMNCSLSPDEQIQLDLTRPHSLTVSAGIVCVRLDDDDLVLTPGDRVDIPAGPRVRAWNAGDMDASLTIEAAPALRLAA